MPRKAAGTTVEDLQARSTFVDELVGLMKKHNIIKTRKSSAKPAPKPTPPEEAE